MKILSISNLKKTYTNYVNKTGEKKTFSPSFLSHPTYDYFEKTSNIRASSHFRRGRYYGTPSENYKDVEYTLKKVLENKKKPSFLLVGIGHGEEAYSLAASIYTILGKPKKLSKVVDFNEEEKKISLSIKALFAPEEPVVEDDADVADVNIEEVASAIEE